MASRELENLDAETLRLIQNHQKELPIKLSIIARELGVALHASSLAAGVSGEIRPTEDRSGFIIKVNRHDSPRRQRFTVAHELAHFLLHRDQIADGISDDVLYRSSLSDSREAEANRLAADLLMPENLVREELRKLDGVEKRDCVPPLADIFEVSEAAIKIRLGLT